MCTPAVIYFQAFAAVILYTVPGGVGSSVGCGCMLRKVRTVILEKIL